MYKLFSVFLILNILRPAPVEIFGESLGMRIIDAIYFYLIFVLFILLIWKVRVKIKLISLHCWLFLFFAIQVISLTFSAFFNAGNIVIRDLFELYRIPFYILIFSFAFSLDWDDDKIKRYLYRPIIIGVLVNFIMVALQIKFDWFKDVSYLIYGGKLSIASDIWRSRVIGTFYNPNFFGIFVASIASASFINLLINNKSKLQSLILGFISLPFLYLSNSRTALISFFITIILIISLYAIIQVNINPVRGLCSIAFLLILVLIIMVFILSSKRFYELFALLLSWDWSASKNLYGRIITWISALNYFVESPLIGIGPSKSLFSSFDSNYISVLTRYGVLGFASFICIWANFCLCGLKAAIKGRESVFFQYLSVVLIIMMGMVTANYFNVQQLMAIFLLYTGAIYKLYQQKKLCRGASE